MTRRIQDKLASIVDEIDRAGHANQTRLTVLKKWLEKPERLQRFALSLAVRAVSAAGAADDADPCLLDLARNLLDTWTLDAPAPDRVAAKILLGRLKAFQDDHKRLQWGQVRRIHSTPLLLIEMGLEIFLYAPTNRSEGYRLAVAYCEGYGTDLNGESRARVLELLEIVDAIEIQEQSEPSLAA
ncbi:hypothetical protein G3480_07500 [Thiorhodococcus mannitoliphagus]|uniref:Uncharacterized protein n=1 Tax=Thiorhodococcus mannitoliphagus TaxID=329406 RepID=A0A6P1DRJ3_9GAMM|nr:hypothetical protein [Thiorhodococcus mannitoliphagus]NEX20160.1 hypothetical protein [Thiorhodococcus mannitoliphagus]